ncbi:MAG: (Fe-S)-binding protein [Pseudomonadales bacterium]|uniref:Fe-S oxidoreductase n=1 Tax=Oleiphilus messinensis TaxID=141451 RepID=A0A1Y0I8C1_9GAMM|nr:(Fe-S)-binding protein [Oleiphilus messinensis]ARU55684.1 Fe-S oxidoreductase [Oleiphilus messinensis]MCG8613153.1 (Fe-S)-binding protein [Pseudomonadales bacterium]
MNALSDTPPEFEQTKTQKPDRVYFFGTCLIDLFYPDAGLSAIQLIEREGVNVIFPQAQSCCGQPPYNSGYREEAIQVAKVQMDALHESIPVVVPSGSCAGMMKFHYPELFKNHLRAKQAQAFSERIIEWSAFLHRVLQIKLEDLGQPTRVALHTSCSARREMGVTEDGLALLRQLQQVDLAEPERASECCGFGGTFSVKQPEIAASMAADKCNAIKQTGAEMLVSGDCGCLMNLEGTLKKSAEYSSAHTIDSTHLAQFIWQRVSK